MHLCLPSPVYKLCVLLEHNSAPIAIRLRILWWVLKPLHVLTVLAVTLVSMATQADLVRVAGERALGAGVPLGGNPSQWVQASCTQEVALSCRGDGLLFLFHHVSKSKLVKLSLVFHMVIFPKTFLAKVIVAIFTTTASVN